MRGNRRDANHNEIKKHFEKFGWTVKCVADLHGFCDLIVTREGFTICIEVKDGSKPPSQRKLTADEKKFRKLWSDHGRYLIIQNIEEVELLSDDRSRTLLYFYFELYNKNLKEYGPPS